MFDLFFKFNKEYIHKKIVIQNLNMSEDRSEKHTEDYKNQGWALRSYTFWTHPSFAFFKGRNVLLRFFFKFSATYETQKNDAFFFVLFLRM